MFEEIKGYKDSDTLIHYHDYKLVDSKDSTCDKSGYKAYKCNCGEEKKDTISALGHNYSSATCTAAKKCSRCGKTDGSALGHTTGGTKCTRCGASTFKKLTYTGTGKKYIRGINLPSGQFVIKCSYRGESNFIVILYNSDGSGSETLANEIDSCNTEYQLNLNGTLSNAYIDVELAEGSWTITIEAL